MSDKTKQTKAEKTLESILDAALECYTRKGIGKASLEDVAKRADVGRTTIYRYVKNRDDLLNQVVLRDSRLQQQEMAALARYHQDFAQGTVDTIVYIMRGRRLRPINALLFGSDDHTLLDRVNLSPANFYEVAERWMAPLFEMAESAGQIREGVTLAQASHWTSRVVLSLISYPEEFLQDEDALREFLHRFLIPSLVRDSVSPGR